MLECQNFESQSNRKHKLIQMWVQRGAARERQNGEPGDPARAGG